MPVSDALDDTPFVMVESQCLGLIGIARQTCTVKPDNYLGRAPVVRPTETRPSGKRWRDAELLSQRLTDTPLAHAWRTADTTASQRHRQLSVCTSTQPRRSLHSAWDSVRDTRGGNCRVKKTVKNKGRMASLTTAIEGAVVVLFLMVTVTNSSRHNSKYKCGTKPADIVFLLDSSGSIWERDFPKQLRFVEGVVDMFDVSQDSIRIGVVSFSNWAFVDFQLNSHKSEHDVRRAIRNIAHIRGDTNTASALRYMRTVMFSAKNGARPDIPHIAIVITDGKSNNPQITQMEAAKAHAQGIHLFAIGVGNSTDNSELYSLASEPHDHYVFTVEDYNALLYIEDIVAIKTCKVIDDPSLIGATTTPSLPRASVRRRGPR
ncbi:Cartilage matrix protein [Lamellibrachia satsuma]|nr:Cartilage matrix protein [Lamellibrachia satsuma]